MTVRKDMERRAGNVDLAKDFRELELKVVEGFAKLNIQHETMITQIFEANEKQVRVLESIYGNGKEGLVTKIAKIEQKQNWIWALIVGCSTTAISLALVVFRQYL